MEDPVRVIAGHQSRPEIPFRPVSFEDGQAVVEDRVDFLWTKHGQKLYKWMVTRQEVINDKTKEMTKLGLLEIMDAMCNDNRPGEVVQMVLDNVVLDSFDEANKAAQVLMDIWNNIPHWELKGWTPNEVMEKYEKTSLRPLPATGFPESQNYCGQAMKSGMCLLPSSSRIFRKIRLYICFCKTSFSGEATSWDISETKRLSTPGTESLICTRRINALLPTRCTFLKVENGQPIRGTGDYK